MGGGFMAVEAAAFVFVEGGGRMAEVLVVAEPLRRCFLALFIIR